jgi:DNA invertase Pin-like site-specific DNA recombinase
VSHFLVYVRRSFVRASDADVSDEVQVAAAKAMLPAGATHEVLADSGGHHSGRTDARDGFQELLARVEARRCDGVAVYDLSRLARNARLMLNLHHALERAGIPLLIANMPNTRWDTATGRFMLGQLALAAQFQADVDSERAKSLHRALFEDGRHRGPAPFGYRSVQDEHRRRALQVDEDEATIVRRIFDELPHRSLSEVGDRLRSDGIPSPSPNGWTKYAVREIRDRATVYLGQVVEHRGADARPGRHTPIITPEQAAAAATALGARDHGGRFRSAQGRTYLLSGVLRCRCDRRMTGQASDDRRYYVCRTCRRPMVKAGPLEVDALAKIAAYRADEETVEEARRRLRARLAQPAADGGPRRRRRLEARLEALRKQHGWGDIDDATYRRERAEVDAAIAALPAEDRLVAFDRQRATVLGLVDALPLLTAEEQKRAIALFVARMTPAGEIEWTLPVRPFFALAPFVEVSRGRRGLTPTTEDDDLAWFTA